MTEQALETLLVRLVGDGSSYLNMLNESRSATTRVSDDIQSSLNRMTGRIESAFGRLGGLFAGLGSMVGTGFGIGTAVGLASEAEQSAISFEVFLGSAERARTMLADIRDFAARTPFEMAGLQQSAQLLLNFGVASEEIMPILKTLGDVAAGDAAKLRGMSYAFAQTQAAGRLMGQDLLQMINWGFNPLQEISRTSGKAMAVLKQEMEKGGISAKMVMEAFRSASQEGGKFFGMTEKQAQSFGGLMSTVQDEIKGVLRTFGEMLLEPFKALMIGFLGLNEQTRQAIVAISAFSVALAGIRFAVAITGMSSLVFWTKIYGSVIFDLIKQYGVLGTLLPLLAASAGTLAAIAAIAALAVGVYHLARELYGVNDVVTKLNEEMEKTAGLSDELVGRFEIETAEILRRIENIPDVATKQQVLTKEIERSQQAVAAYERHVAGARKETERANTIWAKINRWLPGTSEAEANLALTNTELAEMQKYLAAAQAQASALGKEFEKIKKAAEHPEILADIKKEEERVRKEIRGIGKSKEDAFLEEARRGGATTKELADLAVLYEVERVRKKTQESKEAEIKKNERLAESVKDLTSELEQEIALYGLSEAAKSLRKLELSGAGGKELQRLKEVNEQMRKLKSDNALKQQGKTLRDGLKTPLESVNEEAKNIRRLFDAGVIDQSTVDKAIERLNKSLPDTHTISITFEAVGQGVDAIARVQEFMDSVMPSASISLPTTEQVRQSDIDARLQDILQRPIEAGNQTLEGILTGIGRLVEIGNRGLNNPTIELASAGIS